MVKHDNFFSRDMRLELEDNQKRAENVKHLKQKRQKLNKKGLKVRINGHDGNTFQAHRIDSTQKVGTEPEGEKIGDGKFPFVSGDVSRWIADGEVAQLEGNCNTNKHIVDKY